MSLNEISTVKIAIITVGTRQKGYSAFSFEICPQTPSTVLSDGLLPQIEWSQNSPSLRFPP